MANKFDQYSDVLFRLVGETVACSPREWTKGALTIDCDGTHINYQLKNEGEPGRANISEKLRDLIDELYVRMSRNGDAWTQASISFRRDGDEVKFDTSFQPAHATAPGPAASPPKPWWRFWA